MVLKGGGEDMRQRSTGQGPNLQKPCQGPMLLHPQTHFRKVHWFLMKLKGKGKK